MRYQEMLAEFVRTPWAMLPDRLASLYALVAGAARGDSQAQEELEAKITDWRAEKIAQADGRIGLISIADVITHRSWWGISTTQVARDLRAFAADPSIKVIILDIDSPGGTVSGVEELAREIHAAREHKPIVAVANSMAASAAYWLASQASDVVVTPTGQVGSIGVYAGHADYSQAFEKMGIKVTLVHAGRYKVEGNPFQPLDDEARAELQRSVDEYYRMFVSAVERGRGELSEDVMQGRMYSAEQALKHRLVDRVATLDETIHRYAGQAKGARGKRALSDAEIEAMRLLVL